LIAWGFVDTSVGAGWVTLLALLVVFRYVPIRKVLVDATHAWAISVTFEPCAAIILAERLGCND